MEIKNNIFEKGSIGKLLFKFAIPSIFALLISELYNMVDIIYAGHYVGPDAIAGLTVVFPIQRLLIALGLLIAVGSSTYAARSFGEQDNSEIRKLILNSLSLTLILISVISILIFFFRKPILYTLGASKLTYPLAEKYVSIILIGGVFQALSTVICYIMISFGKTKILVYTNLVGVILSTIINYILVVLLNFGIVGSAMATVISQIAAFIFAWYNFKDIIKSFKIDFSFSIIYKSISKEILNQIITVGFSTFVIEFADAIVAMVLNNILYTEGGDAAIAMVGVITKVSMFMFITIIGISSAMQPIIAYNFGAENYERMKDILKVSIKAIIITSFAFWAILILLSKPIISFLLNNNALANNTVKAFRVCIFLLPLVGIYYIVIYYYQAIGEAKKSFLLSIYREIVILIPMAVLFIQLFGIKGVWAAYPVTDSIVSLTSIYLLNKGYKTSQSYLLEHKV